MNDPDANKEKLITQLTLRKEILLLSIIIGFAILLRIIYFYGIDFDGSMYALLAKNILDGTYNLFDLHYYDQGVRYSLLLPLAAIYKIAGISDWTTVSLVFVASIIQIVFIYIFGKNLFGKNFLSVI